MATKATELAQLSRKLTYNESSNVASFAGGGTVITTSNDTDDLSEGSSNLYHTAARARGSISASGSLAYNSSTGALTYNQANSDSTAEGSSNLYFTNARVASYLTTNSYATETYVTTQINNLIDSSPAALNTLNELAAALNDDANFSTTITNSIATKATLAEAIDEATALSIALG